MVIIGLALQFSAVSASQADALADAAHAYRQKSAELNGGKEGADQMIGSSVAFYDELSPAELKKGAEMCLKAVGDKFEADE